MKTLVRIISLALLVAGLQGCSTLRLAYNQAPRAASWYLDDYLDFNDTQRAALKTVLQDIQNWHRQTQLPGYIEVLQTLEGSTAADLTAPQACRLYAQVQGRLTDTLTAMASGSPQAVQAIRHTTLQTLATLEPAQLTHLERRFAKSNAKYRKDYVDGPLARREKKRLEQTISRANMLYGDLNKDQENLLKTRLEQSGFDAELAFAERLRRQQALLQALRGLTQASAEARPLGDTAEAAKMARAQAAWVDIVAGLSQSPDPVYRAYSQQTRLSTCQTLAELHNSTGPAQRQAAAAKLHGYAQDLRAVMPH